jgi:polyphenol oxidase
LITSEKDLVLSVLVADCVPIIFYDEIKNIIAVAHAGWR